MRVRYRLVSAAASLFLVASGIFGILSAWPFAWTTACIAGLLSLLSRHIGQIMVIRGVKTLLRRHSSNYDGFGQEINTAAFASKGDLVRVEHQLVRITELTKAQSTLQDQALRQIIAEARVLRLRQDADQQR